jgi:glycosyltransferase involved in cell wall biosynthesis
MATPLVSVIVPAYNAEPYLADALESVFAQDYPDLDVIVVDDGSDDDTAGVAERRGTRVRLFRQPNRGAGAARNAGIDAARGSFVAFLDADDLWVDGRLAAQLAVANADAAVDFVFGHVEQFVSPEVAAADAARVECPEGSVPGYTVGALLARAQSLRQVGRFREDVRVGEFIDWYARAADLGMRSEMLPVTVLRRRIHSTNLGIRRRDAAGDYAVVLKAALDRRRAAG